MQTDGFSEENNICATEIVKCTSCGSNMTFDPDKQQLVCPHCGTIKAMPELTTAKEINLIEGFNEDDQWKSEEAVVFRCDNCGAKVVLNKNETANICPFCGTPHVTKTDELPGLKPNGVVPFKFGTKKAIEYCRAWAKKRIFAPRNFRKNLKNENVSGVYVPCFTFDSYTTSVYDGKIGITHVRTTGSGKNRHTTTYTEWKHISGTYYDNFDDVLITAGSQFDQTKLDKISPYDTNNGKNYFENYLLGFMAYRYDYEITDCWDNAKKTIDDRLKRAILSKYVHDKVAYFNISTTHEKVTYKYEMLPVYIGNYKYTNKLYNFYINGENGKVWGKSPKSIIKIILVVLVALGLIGLLIYLVISGKINLDDFDF